MMLLSPLFFLTAHHVRSQTLESVFGPLPRISAARKVAASAAYLDIRKDCVYPLELLILQESTAAFADDFVEMQQRQLPAMLEGLSDSHPNTTVSVVFFTDKPLKPYGDSNDFCQKMNKLTSDRETITGLYEAQSPAGGGDIMQNNLGAMLAAAESELIGWGANEVATKVILHVTDSAPHFWDGKDAAGFKPPRGGFIDATAAAQCLEEYYPSPSQTREALSSLSNLHVAHLVYDPGYLQGDVARSWIWFNRYHGQPDEFVNLRSSDSSDFWHKLQPIISRIDQIECAADRSVALPSTKSSDCGPKATYCKNGVSVRLGFRPDHFNVDVRP